MCCLLWHYNFTPSKIRCLLVNNIYFPPAELWKLRPDDTGSNNARVHPDRSSHVSLLRSRNNKPGN